MERSKNFHWFLGIAAFLIAGSAGFFSVFGLSKLFSGAALSVIIMAGSLEFGKLVGASFLYRYWDKITSVHKFYMTSAVGVLILITSFGIECKQVYLHQVQQVILIHRLDYLQHL